MKNPQNFKIINELMQNNGDPMNLAQQIMTNMQPQQKQNLLNQCKSYGMPEKILSQLQNMK